MAEAAVIEANDALLRANLLTRQAVQITQAYRSLMGFEPSLTVMTVALADLAAGKTIQTFLDELIHAFSLNAPKTSNDTFVTNMYLGALGRQPDAVGLRFWSDQLSATPPQSRAQLLLDFNISLTEKLINSDTVAFHTKVRNALTATVNAANTAVVEDLIKLATFQAMDEARIFDASAAAAAATGRPRHATQVAQLYLLFFNRSPDPGGMNHWITQLANGTSLSTVAQLILDNPEGRGLWPATMSSADFVSQLYVDGLGRAPSVDELAEFTAQLSAGVSRGQVVVNLLTRALTTFNTGNAEAITSRNLFMARVTHALSATAAIADKYAIDMAGAEEAAREIALKGPIDYANTAISGIDTIISQARVGGSGVDKITVDRWGNVLTVTDPRNANWKVHYTYNVYNQVTEQSKSNGYGVEPVKVKTKYDNVGRVVETVDGMGVIFRKAYNHNGYLSSEASAVGTIVASTTTYETDLFGNRKWIVQGNGVRTDYAYDRMGNQVERRTGYVSIFYVNKDSMLLSSASGQIVDTFVYDELGRRIKATNTNTSTIADPTKTSSSTTEYDLSGNVIRTSDAAGYRTVSAFDAFNHKIAERKERQLVGQAVELDATQRWAVDAHGRVQSHFDLAGVATINEYNGAGQLVSRTKAGNAIKYAYDGAAGQLTSVYDVFVGTVTTFDYDRAGNRVLEKMYSDDEGHGLLQNHVVRFDALGRMLNIKATVDGADYTVAYVYDNNGNRLQVTTTFTTDNNVKKVVTVNGQFDAMNRQTRIYGTVQTTGNRVLSTADKTRYDTHESSEDPVLQTTKAIEDHTYTYDGAGNRKTDTYNGVQERYDYDAAGRLVTIVKAGTFAGHRYYDGASRVVQTWEGTELRSTVYDGAGRTIRQRTATKSTSAVLNDVYYSDSLGNVGYDKAGNLLTYRMVAGGATTTYTITYKAFDTYKEESTKVEKTGTAVTRTSNRTYDAYGNLLTTRVQAPDGTFSNQTFFNDSEGHVLRKEKDGLVTRSLIVNGQFIGNSDRTSESFSSVIEPISSPALTAPPSTYTVRAGDTLQSIAKAVWGDATLWWLLADANGVGNAALTAGTMLTLPTRSNTLHNDYDSFKPYDAAKIVGDTTPSLPVPPADKGGCGAIGKLLVVVIAVAATVLTAGAAAAAMATTGSALASAGAVTAFSTMSAAVSLGSITLGNVVLAGAIGGAVGSIAGQGLAMAMGMQDSFDWKNVGMGALGGALSAGFAASGPLASTGRGFAIARAAAGTAIGHGVGSLLSRDISFSWRNVAASAAGAAAGSYAADAFNSAFSKSNDAWTNLARGSMSGFAAGVASQRVSNGKVDYRQISADAFGNALGSSVASTINDSRTAARIEADQMRSGQEEAAFEKDAWAAKRSSATAFMPELKADGTRPVYDFGDPFEQDGVTAAAGRPTRSGNVKLSMVPRALQLGLRDPSVLNDPDAMRKMYSIALDNSRAWLPESLSPMETSLTTGTVYREVFGNDRSAIWFGLAPYATSKVGETFQALENPVAKLFDKADYDIVRTAFKEGNRAIFMSMFTAEQFYQAGGTDAVRAMVNIDPNSFGADWNKDNAKYSNALVSSFELRDQAKSAMLNGSAGRAEELLGQSLRSSADFEQRVIIQQQYDTKYTATDLSGNSVTRTLRQSIQGLADLGPKWYAERMSIVTINGQSLQFTGNDVGDVNQRMPFVYSLAGNLMKAYGSGSARDWLSGSQRIYQDQFGVMQKTYGADAVFSTRRRLGF